MISEAGRKFSEKYGTDELPNPRIQKIIKEHSSNDEVPCAVAFHIARDIHVLPTDVGKTIDLMNYRLVKCQLGLFGYKPEKKLIKPRSAGTEVENAIRESLENDRISCKKAWEIASLFKIPILAVGNTCEAIGIKIINCQLGAF